MPGFLERMDHYNVPDPWLTGEDQFILRDALGEVRGDFDLARLHGPPHVQFCAWTVLAAADGIVVPLQPEDYGAQGVAAIQDSIDRVRSVANPSLALLGFLVTMYNKALLIHVTYETNLRAVYGSDVFDAVVPLAKDFKEAVTVRKPVAQFKPRSAASKAVSALAEGLLRRLDERVLSAGAGKEGCLMAGVSKNGEIQGQSLSSLCRGRRPVRPRRTAPLASSRVGPSSTGPVSSRPIESHQTRTHPAPISTPEPWIGSLRASRRGASSSRSGSAGTRARLCTGSSSGNGGGGRPGSRGSTPSPVSW